MTNQILPIMIAFKDCTSPMEESSPMERMHKDIMWVCTVCEER